jgi:hypothetical protein
MLCPWVNVNVKAKSLCLSIMPLRAEVKLHTFLTLALDECGQLHAALIWRKDLKIQMFHKEEDNNFLFMQIPVGL